MPATALAQRFDDEAHIDWVTPLKRDGYVIIRGLMPRATVGALHADLKERFEKTPFCEGEFYGPYTKRFGALLKRSAHAAGFIANPAVLEIAQGILGPFCESFQLNNTQALEIWPGAPQQVHHRDQGMWPVPIGQVEYMFNVMWPFTPYREENGATLIWPGSNHCQEVNQIDPAFAISAEMEPGDALVYLGSTMHAAGANRTGKPRTGMIVGYSLGWLKQFENQFLCYPPEVAKTFSPELAGLVGYRQHRPNLGNYEGQCPSILLQDEIPEYIHSVDGLTADQLKLVAQFKASQALGPVLA